MEAVFLVFGTVKPRSDTKTGGLGSCCIYNFYPGQVVQAETTALILFTSFMIANLLSLPPRTKDGGCYNVIIETPKGSRNKFAYDAKTRLFQLKGVLPEGSSFPYDFGFVPATIGEDGDPLDVLVLMDAPAFPGCLIEARLIGAVEAEQTEDGKTERNDRLLAVSAISRQHLHIQDITDLPLQLLDEIEHFFKSYNDQKGVQFKVVGRTGAQQAAKLISAGVKAFKHSAS
jgi:inorganic pyrophosphatase